MSCAGICFMAKSINVGAAADAVGIPRPAALSPASADAAPA
jgi:hypothetical protein